MKEILKYLGAFFVLIGAGVLVAYSFSSSPSNTYLWLALVLMIIGLVGHVLLNKYIK